MWFPCCTKMDEIVKAIRKATEEISQQTLMGLPLEECSPRLLNVTEANLDDHVVIQPAAVAYYGMLLKDAKRYLDVMTRQYKRWEKKKYADAKAALGGSKPKATVSDIESKYVVDNERDIEDWENKIYVLQERTDTFEVWYEAWRQKSYVLRQHADLAGEELNSTSSLGASSSLPDTRQFENRPKLSERTKVVRDIMKRKAVGNDAESSDE